MDAEQTEPSDQAAKRRRFRIPAGVTRILTINVIVGLLIGAGFYGASERASMFLRWAGFSGAGALRQEKIVGQASLDPGDPVLRFAETRIGQLLFAASGQDNCQRLLFDNRNGRYYDTPAIFCGPTPEQTAESDAPARLIAISKSLKH